MLKSFRYSLYTQYSFAINRHGIYENKYRNMAKVIYISPGTSAALCYGHKGPEL